MKPLPKVRAGGILALLDPERARLAPVQGDGTPWRQSLDNTWQTPPRIADPARVYFGGGIRFDPATGPSNPMQAERFCLGPARAEGVRGALLGHALGGASLAAARAALAGAMPYCSGLEVPWEWPTWVNPPYGRELKVWLQKIGKESQAGQEIMGLLPCSRWEQAYLTKALRAACVVLFIRGRVAFISTVDMQPVRGNPYASMLVGWNTDRSRWLGALGHLGACFDVRATRRRLVLSREVKRGDVGPLFRDCPVPMFPDPAASHG